MTKILLPKLLEKKGGVIVNLSSSAAEMNPPMFSVYNATKVIISVS
jgi:NADP-dependent 3-hydroxy acid dehydrogenase YdfG